MTQLLADARGLVRRHRPGTARLDVCSVCAARWPCPPYRNGRQVLKEHGQPRPAETEYGTLAAQLVGEVEARLLTPLVGLLDEYPLRQARLLLPARAEDWARELVSGDEAAAIGLVARLTGTLYGPAEPPAGWWRTPVGQVVARRFGHPTAAAVSYPVAGAMLGVTRQAVHDLVARGKLDRHPDGGVRPESIRVRLTSRRGTTGA